MHDRRGKSTLASAIMLAAALGLPEFGQQIAMQVRRNKPGEELKLRVPRPRSKRTVTAREHRTVGYTPTPADLIVMDAAQARRALRPQGVCLS